MFRDFQRLLFLNLHFTADSSIRVNHGCSRSHTSTSIASSSLSYIRWSVVLDPVAWQKTYAQRSQSGK